MYRDAGHVVRIDWHEPGSCVTYEVPAEIAAEWTGPRIRIPALDAWWQRGEGPPGAKRMPELVGDTVAIHVDGVRQVYVLREWRPGPAFPLAAYDGYFIAEWPDLRDAEPPERL